ncbi:triphosphoribosyl-dephospho-CoA synthase MdcB [Acetobacter conturbans]|uniref:Probable 2-(5''-triphosphoribosyl)-3'-dephosphocoenzyme-A synthase n=1 Tax=Acetobacter conturbans TaxID=1737472 RepID=A0ABX0K6E7_9PROT|nr:triphosphoribosyl-dephospho-CoA synthase MdcB [Acetobacter conturbans]NHN89750.1 triphosphoribosyl-dephospho-CoA synthase MdcB [Acetobacter conturbans]
MKINVVAQPAFHLPLADAQAVALVAGEALLREVMTWPKPGLVSHIDNGSHTDMDMGIFLKSAQAITPFFGMLFLAGYHRAGLPKLRSIGLAAEQAMLTATGGINTHRGAIWGLGLLSAAIGWRTSQRSSASSCDIVRSVWGHEIRATPNNSRSHGGQAKQRYGAGGAREEAQLGFPIIRHIGLPALRLGRIMRPNDEGAARVQCCMALIAAMEDTNLLHRGGPEGLIFARRLAGEFLMSGGIAAPDWKIRAASIHGRFTEKKLSPGGAADGLALCLFLDRERSLTS